MLLHWLLASLAIGGTLLGMPSWFEASAQTRPGVRTIAVEGTEIVVRLTDDTVLRSEDLVGATLDVRFEGRPAKVRIAGVELDPDDKSKTVWLHAMEGRQADGTWQNLCSSGPD